MSPQDPSRRRSLVLLIGAAFVFVAFPASADHAQETAAGTVTFDHGGGNEWWVEVVVTHDGSRPDEVHAWDEGAEVWRPLEWKDWGEWAGSFHIEPGSRVMFRSIDHVQGSADSCWFTHPDGVEQCEGGGDDGRSDPTFDATFSTSGGNEWWVEVFVEANDLLAGVEARDDGGEWVTLTKRDWGAWAASFHVEDGSLVDFRATSTDGGTDISGTYRWPEGTQVSEEPDEDVGSGTFDVAFAPKGGADDWVEVIVDSTEAEIASVDARVDGGDWSALEQKPWHAWAAGLSAPDGSDVEFRATSDDGRTATSIAYRWTEAEPSDGHGGGFEADFSPKAGNEWWVEVFVDADEPVVLVQAKADDGPWHDLEKKSWGAWANSFHVPDGSVITFRAHDDDGERDLSGRYVWPEATQVSGAPPHEGWPHEGSYAVYEFVTGYAAHTGGPITVGNITFVYHDDAWQVHCFGYTEQQHDGSREPYSERGTYPPPIVDEEVAVGDEVEVPSPGCGTRAYNPVEVVGTEPRDTRYHGEPVTITTWHGSYIPDCRCYEDWGYWDTDTGLVHSVGHAGSHEGNRAVLEDTDAPIV